MLDMLYKHGGAFGYNVIKCHFITKPEFVQKAEKVRSGLDADVIEIIELCFQLLVPIKLQQFSERKVIELL